MATPIPLVQPDDAITADLFNAIARTLNELTGATDATKQPRGLDRNQDVIWAWVVEDIADGALWGKIRQWDDIHHIPIGPELRLIGTEVSPLPALAKAKIVAVRRFRDVQRKIDTYRLVSGASGSINQIMVVTTTPGADDTTIRGAKRATVTVDEGTLIFGVEGDEVEVLVLTDPSGGKVRECSPLLDLGCKFWATRISGWWVCQQILLVGKEC